METDSNYGTALTLDRVGSHEEFLERIYSADILDTTDGNWKIVETLLRYKLLDIGLYRTKPERFPHASFFTKNMVQLQDAASGEYLEVARIFFVK